jgi:hypothetical protein
MWMDRIWRSEENEKRNGSKLSRAEVALAFTKEDESGLRGRTKGNVDFCLEGEIVHRHGFRAQQGVDKG